MEALDPIAIRVLGSLIEKEATTPEYYPLSLNALVNACNQKSSREPVMDLSEDDVRDAIERLRGRQLAFIVEGSRVTKYRQRISESLNLGRRELAVLCPLLLRGAQTLGEIRDRSERLFTFADLDEVTAVLEKLANVPDGALVTRLPRQPGQKELRYAHLMGGEPANDTAAPATPPIATSSATRLDRLESELEALRSEVDQLRRQLEILVGPQS